ncbi:MAG TPA: alpha/beta fold hydrolase [Acidimicrobiales bacterium]|nr:alpha/beta fold hydrolase [Acidimicrobiales bacterium]
MAPPSPAPSETPAAPPRELEVSLTAADGVSLAARLRCVEAPRGAVVVAHGMGGSMDDAAVIATVEALEGVRFAVVTYDARGHGRSSGTCTLGEAECLDVAAAAAVAREVSDTIYLVGASMGGIAVLRHAASTTDLAGVVTVSTPGEWKLPRTPQGLMAAGLTRSQPGRWVARRWLRVRLSSEWRGLDPPARLASILEVPLAIIHGRSDRFVPATAAQKLFAAARGPRRLDLVRGMGHAYQQRAVAPILAALEWAATARVRASAPAT